MTCFSAFAFLSRFSFRIRALMFIGLPLSPLSDTRFFGQGFARFGQRFARRCQEGDAREGQPAAPTHDDPQTERDDCDQAHAGQTKLLRCSSVKELLAWNPDALFVSTIPAGLAAKAATSTVPIVIVSVADPQGVGLIADLLRPGGNITGVTNIGVELAGKRLEILKEIAPTASRDSRHHKSQRRERSAANV